MNLTLTLKTWNKVFKIDPIDIVDELHWEPYCLAEGTAYDDTEATLNYIQIARLSIIKSSKLEKLIRKYS